jgi:hypothetical protein
MLARFDIIGRQDRFLTPYTQATRQSEKANDYASNR